MFKPHSSTTPRKKSSSVIGASTVDERITVNAAEIEVTCDAELLSSTREGEIIFSATRAATLVPIPNTTPEMTC